MDVNIALGFRDVCTDIYRYDGAQQLSASVVRAGLAGQLCMAVRAAYCDKKTAHNNPVMYHQQEMT
jgi:hypothetical protein